VDLDYYQAMTDAVVEATQRDPDRLTWVMNADHRAAFAKHLENEVGVEDDNTMFGIEIVIGEPSNGQPFELVERPVH